MMNEYRASNNALPWKNFWYNKKIQVRFSFLSSPLGTQNLGNIHVITPTVSPETAAQQYYQLLQSHFIKIIGDFLFSYE